MRLTFSKLRHRQEPHKKKPLLRRLLFSKIQVINNPELYYFSSL